MSIPKIDPYPPAPTPEDDEATFDEKAYEHAASLEVRRVQMNEVATYVNTRAADANSRAVAAAASATASSNSAARADEWANKVPGSVVASGKYSARHYSDLSDKFANAPEDVEVEPGKYSALHWQEKAKKIADVHATTVATDPLPTVLATNVQEALQDLAYQADQLRIAKNQLKYGDGPYPVLDFQFQGAKLLDPRIEFTRASVDWDEEGNEYGINEPVITDQGLWVSGARTNLLTWSEDFTKSDWAKRDSPIENGVASSPAGGAAQVVIDSTRVAYLRQTLFSIDAGIYTYTVYFKKRDHDFGWIRIQDVDFNSLQLYFNLDTLEISGSTSSDLMSITLTRLSGGWIKLTVGVEIALGDEVRIYAGGTHSGSLDSWLGLGDGESGTYIWGVQLEAGTHPTSYIPTEGSQVTVAETVPSFYATFGGTHMAELVLLNLPRPVSTALIGDYTLLTGNNPLFLSATQGFGVDDRLHRLSGATPYTRRHPQNNVRYKYAASLSELGAIMALDGESFKSSNPMENLYNKTRYRVFSRYSNSATVGNQLTGYLRRYLHFSTPLSEQQLRELTS